MAIVARVRDVFGRDIRDLHSLVAWAYPAIERALLRASHGALRAGVVLAIAVTVFAAGGVWAYVYAQ